MTELSEQQTICTRCKTDYSNDRLELLIIGDGDVCQSCEAELSGKYAGLPPKPFFKAALAMPPSVNGYWLVKPKGKYLSARARKFRSEVIAYVASLNGIRTHQGRIKAVVTLHGATKRNFDVDNFMKGIGDALTHARVYRDDSQIDELVVKRGEVIKGGRVDVELYELNT